MLSHINPQNQPEMVDISAKAPSRRSATAVALVDLPEVIRKLFDGSEISSPKGPVIQTAIVAGTMAVKRTSELIPFCHPIPVEKCRFRIDEESGRGLRIECEVATTHDHQGRPVLRLEYEAFAALAEREGLAIVQEAADRFDILAAACVHRTGSLEIGEVAVWIGVVAPHRDAAFAACRYIIDEIKKRVPIWKKEFFADGESA